MARDRTTSGCVSRSFPHVLCAMTSTTPTMRTKTRPRRRWKRCECARGCVESLPHAFVAIRAKFVSMPLRDMEESNMHGERMKTRRKERQLQSVGFMRPYVNHMHRCGGLVVRSVVTLAYERSPSCCRDTTTMRPLSTFVFQTARINWADITLN